ncbi:hypothetical protein, partial [Aneurinibacillus aneurinilyticus]|uniref:hypothetical protein n=1 Tax=Aneurinibacillus aneurinilyticus TaxID=1391 RepID=UPI003523D3F4
KNEIRDLTVKRTQAGTPNGKEQATIDEVNYDPNAAYSVTYLVLDRYAFTAPLIDLQGEYRTKLAAVVAEMAQDQADIATRVSVVEMGLSTTRMLVDKILKGEISMGTDFSKQIPKSFQVSGTLTGTSSITILSIKGKGYLNSINVDVPTFYFGLKVVIDGETLTNDIYRMSSDVTSSEKSIPVLLRFNKSLEIYLRNMDSNTRNYTISGFYTLDS